MRLSFILKILLKEDLYICFTFILLMKVENCPKNLNHCPSQMCPMYPCWAFEKHKTKGDVEQRDKDSGWE